MFHISKTTRRLVAREALLTVLAWAILLSVVAWMTLCQQWSDMRWWRWHELEHRRHSAKASPNIRIHPLHDVLLEIVPFVPHVWVSDIFVNSAALICVVSCSLMIKGWQAKLVLLRRIAWMMATLYFLRSITISLTTLPPSLRECKPVLPKDTHELLAHIPGSMSGQISACTDKIFSGHTTILVVSFLFWTRYARHWAFIVYSAIHTVVGMISVLAVRYHYSIDVLLAIVLTFFVHHAYYTALDRAILLRTASPSIARARTFCNDNGVILAVPSGQGSSAYAYNRVQEDDNTIGGQMGLSPADIEKAMSRESSVAVTVPARADDEDLGTEYCVPGDFDEARIRLMAINRSMGSVLPRVVAWMDGLHLR